MASMPRPQANFNYQSTAFRTQDCRPDEHRRSYALRTPPEPSPGSLVGLIEGEIIPRLIIAHRPERTDAATAAAEKPAAITSQETIAFTPLVLELEVYDLLEHVEGFLDRGVAVETVFLDLLAPAARRLGEFWEEDTCDFVQVTLGLWRLQQIVHELASRTAHTSYGRDGNRRAFFAVVPGDQHSFGLVMIEEFFRRDGWCTLSLPDGTHQQLIDVVSGQWFELIGLTVTCEEHIAPLKSVIDALRSASRNPAVAIMVGGRIFTERPELVVAVGADATAPDGQRALAKAEMLLDQIACGAPAQSFGHG
jgi:methanogenic corrinoid protein MtbC1